MANDLQSNINKKLLRSFTKAVESSSVLAKTVSKQLVNDFDPSTGGTGDSVAMKRPNQFVPQRTADGDLSAASVNPLKVGQVRGTVSNYCTVYVENTQVEEALETDQLDELLRPAAEDMVVELESELGTYMANNAALVSGDPDNAIDAWSDIANAGALLKEIGAPSGKRFCAINNFTETNLANLQTQLGVNPQAGEAWNQATVRENFAGFQSVMTTNNLPEYTSGNQVAGLTLGATPAATYTTYKDSYQMSLTITGATPTTGTLKAGQTLAIPASSLVNMRNRKVVRNGAGAALPFYCTVLADATADGSGNMTVSVSGAAIFETGVNGAFNTVDRAITSGDTVTVYDTADTTYRPALGYCEGFVGMGSVVLPKLHSIDSNIMNHKGMSIRVHRFSDGVGNKNRYRFDILPTFAVFNPNWGMKVFGQ